MELSLRVGSSFLDLADASDDAIGETLVGRVRRALMHGEAPSAAVIVRPERLDVIGLGPIVEQDLGVGRFLSTLTRSRTREPVGDVLAVGIVGTVRLAPPTGGERVPLALVFLEWPDCRWWEWKALLDPTDGHLLEQTETRLRAVDGDAMPPGLGRWWSTGRHLRGDVLFDRWPGRPAPESEVVH